MLPRGGGLHPLLAALWGGGCRRSRRGNLLCLLHLPRLLRLQRLLLTVASEGVQVMHSAQHKQRHICVSTEGSPRLQVRRLGAELQAGQAGQPAPGSMPCKVRAGQPEESWTPNLSPGKSHAQPAGAPGLLQ